MPDLGTAYVQIVPSAKGISGSISKVLGGEAASAGINAGRSIGSKLVSTLKTVVAAAGIGKLISSSLNLGGELEQNLGGSEAVFGGYASWLEVRAKNAYKNMGMSASDYMATANKMGSLFQGSGMNVADSLKLTSDAMQRAADVASVMGIDTSMAMESIAGAAKGNFTMMDNLGVAMNATTLEAYALEKGVNFKWNTASNAEKAELAMKMFMDRTSKYEGNFARESSETFSGSLGAMKAAAQDFMANLSLGRDIGPALSNLASTVQTFVVGNLLPMVSSILTQVPGIIAQLPGFLSEILPQLIPLGAEMITNIITGLIDNLPAFLSGMKELFSAIGQALQDVDWMALGTQIMTSLRGAIDQASPALLAALGVLVGGKMLGLVGKLTGGIGGLLGKLGGAGAAAKTAGSAVGGLGSSLAGAVPGILAFSVGVIAVATAIRIIGPYLTELGAAISQIVATAAAGISQIIANITPLISVILNGVATIIATVGSALPPIIDSVSGGIATINDSFSSLISSISDGIATVVTAIGDAISGVLDSVAGIFDSIGEAALNAGEGFNLMADGAAKIVSLNLLDLGASMAALAAGLVTLGASSSSMMQLGDAMTSVNTNAMLMQTTFTAVMLAISASTQASFNQIAQTVKSTMITMANTVRSQLSAIQTAFANTQLSFNQHIALPHFYLSGRFNAETGEVPVTGVQWYAKASKYGALFADPTLLVAGDSSEPEMLLGENTLDQKIEAAVRRAMGDGAGFNQTNNIYSPTALNPSKTSRLIRNQTKQMLSRMRGGV